MADRFIVAELSQNWQRSREPYGQGPIAAQFQRMVNDKAERGYRLVSFSVARMLCDPWSVNETLVAVFEQTGEQSHG